MTTLNLQVGANGNDGSGYAHLANFFVSGQANVNYAGYDTGAGDTAYVTFARWTGISGLSGATITAADVQEWSLAATGTSPTSSIYFAYAAAPAAPIDWASLAAFTPTTAFVNWDTKLTDAQFNTSPDISTVIQELATNFDPTTMVLLWKARGTNTANYHAVSDYNGSSAHAPKLDITYTAGGASTTRPRHLLTLGVGN